MINSNLSVQKNLIEIYKNTPNVTQPNQSVNNKKGKPKKDNSKLYYAVGGVLVGAGTAGVMALCSGGKNKKAITKLQGKVSELTTQVADEIAQRTNIQKQLDSQRLLSKQDLEAQKTLTQKLQTQLNDIFGANPDISAKASDDLVASYRKIAQEASLDYDPMQPAKNGEDLVRKSYLHYIDFVKMEEPQVNVSENFPTQIFGEQIQALQTGKSFSVPLQNSSQIRITKSPSACLSDAELTKLDKWENSDMLVTAGETAKWSKEKIARDLLQNFYDGHGQTLDGVKFTVTKTQSGYKVCISGQSTFDSSKIILIGNTSKKGNPYEAGGFGEGLKMVNASMFGNHLTENVRYGSADWVYDIAPNKNGVIQRKLSQVENFDGNFVEFETSDVDFVKKLVNATNYFEHSKNTDFQNVIYQNQDMGISFLGKDKKGNFYLTQRFAYGKEDGWEQNLDGLTLFFRRKPKIDIGTGRDRRFVSNDDLEKVIGSFVEDVSEDDALQIIMKMQSVWAHEPTKEKKAYKILLEQLCKKYNKVSSKKIDLTQQKFVACREYELSDSKVMDRLREYGYIPCEHFFAEIGMPNVREVLSQYSAHKPLPPTPIEIKKIKLLSEAAKIVADEYKVDNKVIVEKISKIDEEDIIRPFAHFSADTMKEVPKISRLESMYAEESLPLFKKHEEFFVNNTSFENMPFDIKQEVKQNFDTFVKGLVKNIQSYDEDLQNEILILLNHLAKKGYLNSPVEDIINPQINSQAIIKLSNPSSPVHIFDRHAEKCENTLAEAMIKRGEYKGHWVSRDHLEKASFSELLATWLHEMCHQYAGDGDSDFGYKLTDLLGDVFNINPQKRMELAAIKKAFDELNVTQG